MGTQFVGAIAIFLLAYALIISERVHRTVVALTGAILLIVLGILNQEQALHGVDFNTLGLLIGMMIIVGIAKDSGVFQAVAIWVSKLGKGKPVPIFILLGLTVALFSAVLDNVTTVLLMVPVVFVVANNLKVPVKPFLIGAILLSNVGGAATLIGDPPNILIGSAAKIDFNAFLVNLGPISLVTTIITVLLLAWWYKRVLLAHPGAAEAIMAFKPQEAISDRKLLVKSLVVIGVVLAGFFTHSLTHFEGATIALGGAALLLLLTMNDPEEHLRSVEWTTIFFFIGLFILVTGLEQVGAIRILAEQLLEVTGGQPVPMMLSVLWGSAILSAIVDNIPFVATMIPLIQEIGVLTGLPLLPLWWALALGADFGGNATIIGASANVVVSGMAKREGSPIGFGEYFKIAAPITVVGLILCTGYLLLRYT